MVDGVEVDLTPEEEAELAAFWAESNARKYAWEYIFKRLAEYPSIQDLADALVHQHMGDGGEALNMYLEKCADVKRKYPKP